MNASDVSKKSRRPSAGNSSSMRRRPRPEASRSGRVSVSRRAIWLRIRRTSGRVREMSDGGTTRYRDTGRSAVMRSAMRQSECAVLAAISGSR
jgi:hypothetical protein